MSNKNLTKTLFADFRKVDTKKLNINGTPFSKVVSADVPETPTANDIWKYAVTTDEEGVVTINTDVTVDYTELTEAKKDILRTTTKKVIDNKVLDANDTLLLNWDTKNFTNSEGSDLNSIFGGSPIEVRPIVEWNSDLSSLTNGSYMFYYSSIESFSGDLSSLVNGNHMFNGTALTSWNNDLSSLTNGQHMFSSTALTSWNNDLSSLTNGDYMFYYCASLESFSGDLSNLTDGNDMFSRSSLKSFDSNLPSLTNGELMFYQSSLKSFNGDLSSLTSGNYMFYYTPLTSFSGDLSNLTNGEHMFYMSKLESFESDLSSLTNGDSMFGYGGYGVELTEFHVDMPKLINGSYMFDGALKLTSFSGDLSSLTNGDGMFGLCRLDPQSVMIINDSIRDIIAEKSSLTDSDYVTRTGSGTLTDPYVYSKPFGWMSNGAYVYTYHNPKPYTTEISSTDVGHLSIGINVTNDSSTINTQLQEFAEAAYYDSWADLKQSFANKGWTVTWYYGGRGVQITLSEDEAFRGVPVWAKIEEVIPAGETYTEEEIAKAEYCTEDGSKYYNISWGHDVNDEAKDETMTDESKYFYFGSLLEACGYWGVIPKQYLEA